MAREVELFPWFEGSLSFVVLSTACHLIYMKPQNTVVDRDGSSSSTMKSTRSTAFCCTGGPRKKSMNLECGGRG